MSGELASERWSPAQRIRTILLSVISLLNEPNTSSPVSQIDRTCFDQRRNTVPTIGQCGRIGCLQRLACREERHVPAARRRSCGGLKSGGRCRWCRGANHTGKVAPPSHPIRTQSFGSILNLATPRSIPIDCGGFDQVLHQAKSRARR